ncbi:hypothetical protein OK016_16895 [Vibrio chagasii]|nr:hypothetical protein [Vibrio chagasii]
MLISSAAKMKRSPHHRVEGFSLKKSRQQATQQVNAPFNKKVSETAQKAEQLT